MTLLPIWKRHLTSALGGMLGLLLAGLGAWWLNGGDPASVWLAAPVGATAVLVFALPASPLAQPWPVLAGNLLGCVIGHLCAAAGLFPPLAAALALGLTILLSLLGRCMHPPAGGMAAMMALASPAVARMGWWFLLLPVGVNLVVLLMVAVLWHRLTGHSYPHRAPVVPAVLPGPATPAALAMPAVRLHHVTEVLEEWGDTIDIAPEDLAALIRAVEARVDRG